MVSLLVINKSQVLQCCRQSGPASTPLLLFGKRAVLRQRQRRAQVCWYLTSGGLALIIMSAG